MADNTKTRFLRKRVEPKGQQPAGDWAIHLTTEALPTMERARFTPDFTLGSAVNIITILIATTGVTLYVASIDAKAEKASQENAYLKDRMDRSESVASESKRDTTARLDRIEAKVDTLLQRARVNAETHQ